MLLYIIKNLIGRGINSCINNFFKNYKYNLHEIFSDRNNNNYPKTSREEEYLYYPRYIYSCPFYLSNTDFRNNRHPGHPRIARIARSFFDRNRSSDIAKLRNYIRRNDRWNGARSNKPRDKPPWSRCKSRRCPVHGSFCSGRVRRTMAASRHFLKNDFFHPISEMMIGRRRRRRKITRLENESRMILRCVKCFCL